MNTKGNQRARLTKMLMKQAYLSLMQTTPAAKITVKDICIGAEVNRSTFYLHYSEPNDILMELEDEAIATIQESLKSIGALNADSPDAVTYLTSFLHNIRKNDELFRLLLVENSDPHFRRKMLAMAMSMAKGSFQVILKPGYDDLGFRYIVSGSIELLAEWIRSDYATPEQTMCGILFNLCVGSLTYICEP